MCEDIFCNKTRTSGSKRFFTSYNKPKDTTVKHNHNQRKHPSLNIINDNLEISVINKTIIHLYLYSVDY